MSHNTASLVHTPLLRLPLEIIELVVLNVVGLSNLLSLGLTCRVLARILFSGHIQYYTVRASIGCVDTWKHLIRNRAYARSVRHLEITPDTMGSDSFRPVKFLEDRVADNGQYPPSPSSQIPSQLEWDIWSERLLAIALHGMANLRSLAWLRSCPPILSGPEDIWSALCQNQYLSDVKLLELGPEAPSYAVSPPKDIEINIRSLLVSPISTTFFGLVRFHLTCVPIPFKGPPMILPVVDLLVSHCPHLESLKIMIFRKGHPWPYPNVDNLFRLGKWPRLRILQLANITFSPTPAMRVALGSFFSNNLAIRHLTCLVYTDDDDITDIIFPPNCLPHLTFLYAVNQMIKAILSCPCSPPRAVEKLRGLTLDRAMCEQSDSSFQGVNKDALLAVQIRSIQTPDDLQLLGMLFPCIEYLDLDTAYYSDDPGFRRLSMSMAECAIRLPSFQNLRALYGIPFESDDPEEENQARIVFFADIFPRLVFLDGPFEAVEIIRGADGLTWRTTYNPWVAFVSPYMIDEP
ncbi:hypothetical protein JB92DRAFT_2913793 [Gautieria morchelliformis]|nr:hypothetical protein JB92DRAFT_2913793 [Gautieria morchelliformis]